MLTVLGANRMQYQVALAALTQRIGLNEASGPLVIQFHEQMVDGGEPDRFKRYGRSPSRDRRGRAPRRDLSFPERWSGWKQCTLCFSRQPFEHRWKFGNEIGEGRERRQLVRKHVFPLRLELRPSLIREDRLEGRKRYALGLAFLVQHFSYLFRGNREFLPTVEVHDIEQVAGSRTLAKRSQFLREYFLRTVRAYASGGWKQIAIWMSDCSSYGGTRQNFR